jgi:hypothetical protein
MARLVNQAVAPTKRPADVPAALPQASDAEVVAVCYQGHSGHCRRRASGTLVQPTVGQLRANPRC